MLSKLNLTNMVVQLTTECTELHKEKLRLQKSGGDWVYPKKEIDKNKKRIKYLNSIIIIVDSMPESSLKDQRNQLMVKIATIEEREPLRSETRDEPARPYTSEEKKTKEVRARIDKEFALYGHKKLKEQLKNLNFILRN